VKFSGNADFKAFSPLEKSYKLAFISCNTGEKPENSFKKNSF